MTEFGRRVAGPVKRRYMLSVMCGRSTYKLTWEEIVGLYRLTLEQPPVNTQARYNVCPTTTIDTIVGQNSERRLVPMRWGLIPSWWSKPLKELKLATFNARAETVAEKPFFRQAFNCAVEVLGHGVLLVFGAPCQIRRWQEHGRTIPLAEICSNNTCASESL
jgi:hypothetical protein